MGGSIITIRISLLFGQCICSELPIVSMEVEAWMVIMGLLKETMMDSRSVDTTRQKKKLYGPVWAFFGYRLTWLSKVIYDQSCPQSCTPVSKGASLVRDNFYWPTPTPARPNPANPAGLETRDHH